MRRQEGRREGNDDEVHLEVKAGASATVKRGPGTGGQWTTIRLHPTDATAVTRRTRFAVMCVRSGLTLAERKGNGVSEPK